MLLKYFFGWCYELVLCSGFSFCLHFYICLLFFFFFFNVWWMTSRFDCIFTPQVLLCVHQHRLPSQALRPRYWHWQWPHLGPMWCSLYRLYQGKTLYWDCETNILMTMFSTRCFCLCLCICSPVNIFINPKTTICNVETLFVLPSTHQQATHARPQMINATMRLNMLIKDHLLVWWSTITSPWSSPTALNLVLVWPLGGVFSAFFLYISWQHFRIFILIMLFFYIWNPEVLLVL